MSVMSRRKALAVLGGTILSPVIPAFPARAEPLTTGMAVLAATSAIIDMMKQGGETELLIRALSAKIDAISANQLLTLQAIGVVDQKLSDLHRVVSDVPAETITLGNQLDAAYFTKSVIVAGNSNDETAYQEYRKPLIELASKIEISAVSSVTVPSLAVAAWHVLNGLDFIAVRDYGLPVKTDAKVRSANESLRQTFTILLSPNSKLSQRLADVRARIAGQEKIIAENATAKTILPAHYASLTEEQPSLEFQPFAELTLCVRRNEPTVQTEVTPNSYDTVTGGNMSPPIPSGGSTWSRESVSHRRMPVKFSSRTVLADERYSLYGWPHQRSGSVEYGHAR